MADFDADPVPPIDVLDQVAVKRTIDDALCKLVVLAGYPEDQRLSNLKLALMTAACTVACYAQLGPHSFPENKQILAASVGFYVIACVLLQILTTFIEKDYVVRTYDKDGLKDSALIIESKMPRGSNEISIKAQLRSRPKTSVSFTKSVGNYYSRDGDLDEICLQKHLQGLLVQLEDSLTKKSS